MRNSLLLLLCLTLVGCLPKYYSVSPICTDAQVIVDDRIVGEWAEGSTPEKTAFVIKRIPDQKAYSYGGDDKDILRVELTTIGGETFLNVSTFANIDSDVLYMPVNYFQKIEFGNGQISVSGLDLELFRHIYGELKKPQGWTTLHDSDVLFFTDTPNLRDMIEDVNKQKLFSEGQVFVKKQIGGTVSQ